MPAPDHTFHTGFLLVYLLALIGVGAVKAGKVKSQADFSLAGRGLSTFVLIGTLLATWIGTGSIFGNAGKTYRIGVPALLLPIGSAAGMVLLYFLAPRIRRFGQFTIQDILERRFGVAARILATIALVGAYLVIVSYQYRAGGAALLQITDLSPTIAVCAVAAFVIVYTALAGMFSVAYTDVANGILMVLGIALALPMLWSQAGGWDNAVSALGEGRRALSDHWGPVSLLGATVPPFLLIIGDANMYQRFFSARDPRSARRAVGGMVVGVLFLEFAIIAVAVLATAMVKQGTLSAPEIPGHIILHAAFNGLPGTAGKLVGALLVATVMAVVVSTADSYLLSPATSLVRDVYQRFIEPDAEGQRIVFLSRAFVVGLGLVALGLSFASDKFFEVALFAYTIYGCAITPALFAAFFWKRATRQGAVASIITGAVVSVYWESVKTFRGADALPLPAMDEAVLVAFPLSVLALVVVSLMTAPPSRENVEAI